MLPEHHSHKLLQLFHFLRFPFHLSTSFYHRCNTWKVTTTKELLPGDIISLAFKKRSNKKVPVKVAPPAIANAAAAGTEGTF